MAIECPVCRIKYVANTLFCSECGLYLLKKDEEIATDPLETAEVEWQGEAESRLRDEFNLPDKGPLTVRLHIRADKSPLGPRGAARELEVGLGKPVRLGRLDPRQDIYPDIDLTDDLAQEHGVSRIHACIFRRGQDVAVEDMGSTNGTLLNGKRLAPYLPERLKDGDQLQLGKLLIEVGFDQHLQKTPLNNRLVSGVAIETK
jgi:hypothetical protein